MTIIDSLYKECTEPVEMCFGDNVVPLQASLDYGCYVIYQWDCTKRCYDKWISTFSAYDTLLRYFRAKCFEHELLNCDGIEKQVKEFEDKIYCGVLNENLKC